MAQELNAFNVTDASNNAAAPNGWASGTMIPSEVEPTGRMMMGALARAYKDNNGSLVTAGTSTAITIILNSQHAAWFDGLTFAARITTTCGATPTINPTGSVALGAKSLYWAASGVQLAAGDLTSTAVAWFMYELTSDKVYVFGAPPLTAYAALAVANTFTANQTITSTDAGATGPQLILYHDSASPAASDTIGQYRFDGEDSAGNTETYAKWFGEIVDPTSTSEDGRIGAQTVIAGALATRLYIGHGAYTANATGGDKGADTINASAIYDDGVQLKNGLVAIERKTGTSTASYDFTTGIDSTYRTYVLEGWLTPATDDVELWFRTDSDGGASFDSGAGTYKYGFVGVNAGSASGRASNADTKIIIAGYAAAAQAVGSDTDQSVHFRIIINAPSNTSLNKTILYQAGHEATDDSGWQTEDGSGMRIATAAINAFQLIFESGNIAIGDVTLYGVANS